MKGAAVIFGGIPGAVEKAHGLLETLNGLGLEEISLWALGREGLEEAALRRTACGRVLWAEDPALDRGEPEGYLPLLLRLCREERPGLVLFPGGLLGEEAAVRLGLELGWPSVTGGEAVTRQGGALRVRRAAYSMNLQVELELPEGVGVVAMAQGLSGREAAGPEPVVERLAGPFSCQPSPCLVQAWEEPRQEEGGLRTAKAVVVGGRGVGSGENMERLCRLAELLGGAAGGSRPVIYDGWLPMDRMVGASAAILAPEKCLVLGASGAAAFAVGVEKSGFLAAVNSDPDARIFSLCDVGVVGDCLEMMDALARAAVEEEGEAHG